MTSTAKADRTSSSPPGAATGCSPGSGRRRSGAWNPLANPDGTSVPAPYATVADFTGDGYADLLLRALDYGGTMMTLRKGSAHGLGKAIPLPDNSRWGTSGDTGDLNGDGRADYVQQAPESRLLIQYGTSEGISAPTFIHKNTLGVPGGDTNLYSFGVDNSIADVNGDGYADLAIGDHRGGPGESGYVFILHGSKNGVTTTGVQLITEKTPGVPGNGERDLFGNKVRLVDLTGDRRPELIVGVPDATGYRGRVVLLRNVKGHITASHATTLTGKLLGVPGNGFGDVLLK